MGEETVYDGYLEVREDGSCLAQLLDLPGCYGRGRNDTEAVAVVTACIPQYYAWLRRHDEYTPDVPGPFRVTVRETVRVGPAAGGFFAADAELVGTDDLDWYASLLDWAYADFGELARGLPPAALAAVGQTVVWPLLQQQVRLISRLEERPVVADVGALPGGPLDQLHQVARACIARLRNASEDERTRTLVHEGERWSLRKVLRRSVLLVREATDMLAATIR